MSIPSTAANPSPPLPAFSNLEPGQYQLQVQDANGCEIDATTAIALPAGVQVNLQEQYEIKLGDSIRLSPTGGGRQRYFGYPLVVAADRIELHRLPRSLGQAAKYTAIRIHCHRRESVRGDRQYHRDRRYQSGCVYSKRFFAQYQGCINDRFTIYAMPRRWRRLRASRSSIAGAICSSTGVTSSPMTQASAGTAPTTDVG